MTTMMSEMMSTMKDDMLQQFKDYFAPSEPGINDTPHSNTEGEPNNIAAAQARHTGNSRIYAEMPEAVHSSTLCYY